MNYYLPLSLLSHSENQKNFLLKKKKKKNQKPIFFTGFFEKKLGKKGTKVKGNKTAIPKWMNLSLEIPSISFLFCLFCLFN